MLFGAPVIAVMLTYIGNTQAGLLPGFPAVHIRGKLFTLLFLFFLFHMQSSFSPYNTAYLAVLMLLLCKLLSILRSFRLKIDILSCFFSVSASLFIMGIIIFLLFFYPQTLGCVTLMR